MIQSFVPAVIAFACASSLAAALGAYLFGQLAPGISLAAVVAGCAAAYACARSFAPPGRGQGLAPRGPRWPLPGAGDGADGLLEALAGAAALALAARHFAYLLYRVDGDLRTLNAFNLGDMPLHLNYIRYIAQGAAWPLQNPIFSGDTWRYPLGADLNAAIWESLGVPTASHLAWAGILLTAATILLARAWASWWGIVAIYFSGGFAGWLAAAGSSWHADVAWKNLFLAALATQRGLLFAVPIGLFLLARFRAALLRDEAFSRFEALWLGFIWGALAFFHPHSFVAVSLIFGGYALIGLFSPLDGLGSSAREVAGRAGKMAKPLLPALAIAVPLGGFWALHASAWLRRASIVRVSWGWTRGATPWIRYLSDNFGPWILALVAIVAVLAFAPALGGPRQRRRLALELALYCALFFLFFNVMLAPWEWDNVKVLIWPYFGFALMARETIGPFLRSWSNAPSAPPWRKALCGAILALAAYVLSASGTRALVEASATNDRSVKLFSLVDLAKTQGALAHVPIDAVFLAKPSYDHSLAYWGRARALGYEGHLWSHGVASAEATAAADGVFRGSADWERSLENLRVTHIFWGPDERAAYGDAPKPWQERLTNVSGVPGYAIYEFRSLASPAATRPSP